MKGNWQGPSKIVAVLLPIVTYKYNLNPCNVHFNFKEIGIQNKGKAMVKIKAPNGFGSNNIFNYFFKLAVPSIDRSLAFIFKISLKLAVS